MKLVSRIKNMGTMEKAVIVSVLGAIISGIVAHMGSSSTVFMDFARCVLDGITTVVSYVVFTKINKEGKVSSKKVTYMQERIRVTTGVVMMCTSILLALVSILSFTPVIAGGNNIPSFFTTSICLCINTRICNNYKKDLDKKFDHIVRAQFTMYRAKTLVNSFVLFVVSCMIFVPSWKMLPYIDMAGTILMSAFLFVEGIKNIIEISQKKEVVVVG